VSDGPLDGYTAIVSGGGTGIGAACAQRLAADGATVVICGRTEQRLVDAAAAIPGSVHPVVADVTDEESVRALVARTLELTGRVDAVVANAGGGGALVPLHQQETAEFVRVLHLNVLGTFLLLKHTVEALAASDRGSFVGMSSIAGGLTHRYFGAYGVGKAGIAMLMRDAADEYGPSGVRFNAVRPGFTDTELMSVLPRDSDVFRSYLDNTPLGGISAAADVADLVRFLVGPESGRVTGQVIGVDGGHGLRSGPDFSQYVPPDPLTRPGAPA
jgi:NAD(P)-dependent dehydrogenase (short-subunit alcohol dehydrogenase family)